MSLALMLIGLVSLILWVLNSQIGNKTTICLFLLIIILYFIAEGVSGSLSNISVKVFYVFIKYLLSVLFLSFIVLK